MIDNQFKLDKVYLEGASGKIDTNWLIKASKTEFGKNFLNLLLENGKISGTEYYSIVKQKNNFIQGIEEKQIYETNIKLLSKINSFRSDIENICDEMDNEINKTKQIYFNSNTKKFDKIIYKKQNKNKLDSSYYKYLENFINRKNINEYKDLNIYLSYLNLKKSINEKKVKKEYLEFIRVIKDILPFSQYKTILSRSNNFKDIENILDDLLEIEILKNDKNFTNLLNYITLLKEQQNFNPLTFIKQEKEIINKIYDSLLTNSYEENVAFISNFINVIRLYFTAQITAQEYYEFNENYNKFKMIWNDYCIENIPSKLEEYKFVVDKYHRNNILRDHIFTNKIVECNNNKQELETDILKNIDNKKIKLVVTGGFHTQGLEKILNNKKVSYIIITPVVNGDSSNANKEQQETINEYSQVLNNTINVPTITETILIETIFPKILPIIVQASNNIDINILETEINNIFEERFLQKRNENEIKSLNFKVELKNGKKLFHFIYNDSENVEREIFLDEKGNNLYKFSNEASIVRNKNSILYKFAYIWEEIAFRIFPVFVSFIPQFILNAQTLSVTNPITIGLLSVGTITFALTHSIYDKINGIKNDNRFKKLIIPSIIFSVSYFVSSLFLSPFISWVVPIVIHYVYNLMVDKGILKFQRASIIENQNNDLTSEEIKYKDISLRLPIMLETLKDILDVNSSSDKISKYLISEDERKNIIYILEFYNKHDEVVSIINNLENIKEKEIYNKTTLNEIEKNIVDLYKIIKEILSSKEVITELPKQRWVKDYANKEAKETIIKFLCPIIPMAFHCKSLQTIQSRKKEIEREIERGYYVKAYEYSEIDECLVSDIRKTIRTYMFNDYEYWRILITIADVIYYEGIQNEKSIYLLLKDQYLMDDDDRPKEANFVKESERTRSLWELILGLQDIDIVLYNEQSVYNTDMFISKTNASLTGLIRMLPTKLLIKDLKQKETNLSRKIVFKSSSIDEFLSTKNIDVSQYLQEQENNESLDVYDKISELDLLAKESFFEFTDNKKTIQEVKEIAPKLFFNIQNMLDLLKEVEKGKTDKYSQYIEETFEKIKQEYFDSLENGTLYKFLSKNRTSFEYGSIDKLISTIHQSLLQVSFSVDKPINIEFEDNQQTSSWWNSDKKKNVIYSDKINFPNKIKDIFLRLKKIGAFVSASRIVVSGNVLYMDYDPKFHHAESKSMMIKLDEQTISYSGHRTMKDEEVGEEVDYYIGNYLKQLGFTNIQDFEVKTTFNGSEIAYTYTRKFVDTDIFLEEVYRQILAHFAEYNNYREEEKLKQQLNNILEYLLLPKIPSNIKLDSNIKIQQFFNDIVDQAYYKGLIRINESGVLEPIAKTKQSVEKKYIQDILVDFENDYESSKEGFKNAQITNSLLVNGDISFSNRNESISIGQENFSIVSNVINIKNGKKIILNGILDVARQRVPWIKVELMNENGTKEEIDNKTFIKLLQEEGFKVKELPERNSGEIQRIVNLLKSKFQMTFNTPTISADIISKSQSCIIGEVTYDKDNSSGKIYIAETLAAGEADVLGKIKGAIVTSGGIYSHGSTQIRESEKMAALVNGQWENGKLKLSCVVPTNKEEINGFNVIKYKTEDTILEEGNIVLMKAINNTTTNIFVFSNELKNDLGELISFVEEKNISKIKEYLSSKQFKKMSNKNKEQILEYLFFETTSNKKLTPLLEFFFGNNVSNDIKEKVQELNNSYINLQLKAIEERVANIDFKRDIDITLNYTIIKKAISNINEISRILSMQQGNEDQLKKLESLLFKLMQYKNNLEIRLDKHIAEYIKKANLYLKKGLKNKLSNKDIRNIMVLIREGTWTIYFGNNSEVKKLIQELSMLVNKYGEAKDNKIIQNLKNIYDESFGGKAFGLAEIKRFLNDERFSDITQDVETLDGIGINPDELETLKEYKQYLRDLENIRQKILSSSIQKEREQLVENFRDINKKAINFLNENREKIKKELYEYLKTSKLDKNKKYAVRSSGKGEDGINSTFAGLAETYLNIEYDQIPDFVIDTMMSFFNDSAIEYIIKNGIVMPRVFVQEFVNMDVAGVIFSDTENGNFTVEAVRGLGMTLVDGDVSPDHIEVKSNGTYVYIRGLNNHIKKVASAKWGVEKKILTTEEKKERLLDSQMIDKINKVTIALKEYYGSAIDVEYGIKNGKLYLLQVRTITTLIDDWNYEQSVSEQNDNKESLINTLVNKLFKNKFVLFKNYTNINDINWEIFPENSNVKPIVIGKPKDISQTDILSISYPIDEQTTKSISIYMSKEYSKPVLFVDCSISEYDKVLDLLNERINNDYIVKSKIFTFLYPTLIDKIKDFFGVNNGYLGDYGKQITKQIESNLSYIYSMLEQLDIASILNIFNWFDNLEQENIQKCVNLYEKLKPLIKNIDDDTYLKLIDLFETKNETKKLISYLNSNNFDMPEIDEMLLKQLNIDYKDIDTIKIIKLIMDLSSQTDERNIALVILNNINPLLIDNIEVDDSLEETTTNINTINTMLCSA